LDNSAFIALLCNVDGELLPLPDIPEKYNTTVPALIIKDSTIAIQVYRSFTDGATEVSTGEASNAFLCLDGLCLELRFLLGVD